MRQSGQNIIIMITLTVPANAAPQRLPAFLRAAGVSLTLRRKIKRAAAISINRQPAQWEQTVAAGDIVDILLPVATTIRGIPMPLCILYEDDAVLIVDKPPGLLVHPTGGEHTHTLANGVIHYLAATSQPPAFHPVHRLDRNTSGLVLIAKNPLAQHLLSQPGRVTRRYCAVATGRLPDDAGTIDLPIARQPGSIIARAVSPLGQAAQTRYRVTARLPQATVLELTLATGRTHQIRVHLSHIGHALYGDTLYGQPSPHIARQALHARSLSFSHPMTEQPLTCTAPLPGDMRRLLAALGGGCICPPRPMCDILLI